MKAAIAIGIFIFGIGAGWMLHTTIPATGQLSENRQGGYRYINPLLECEYSNNMGATTLRDLQKRIEQLFASYSDVEIGLYFRDLTNGPWLGIYEDLMFAPQSLFKLPVAMGYYKLAEQNPEILTKTILYNEQLIQDNFHTDLTIGTQYPVYNLIERTLTASDNIAFQLLTSQISEHVLKQIHSDLGIQYPNESTPDNFVTVRGYASLFRVLYNASYLTRDNSEALLSILAKSLFHEGLTRDLPKETVVAHKYGILNSTDPKIPSQLHDCGIVYHPKKPYILCMMSKGKNTSHLMEVIQKTSSLIFTYFQ